VSTQFNAENAFGRSLCPFSLHLKEDEEDDDGRETDLKVRPFRSRTFGRRANVRASSTGDGGGEDSLRGALERPRH